ncbi:unnamed protein product [Rotaria socialis]|uniref:Cytochrome P450 n=1 Tax=Rotaria socialis TaxID=392032 RepID=A0A818NMY5_9BILA|nr:unnamed protein product [Rotaria socialis]
MTWTLLVVFIGIFSYYVFKVCANNIFRRIGIPGPVRIPFFGELFNVIRKGYKTNDSDLVQKYGNVIGIYEGTTPLILLSDLDLLRNVLIRDSHVFINRRVIENISGPLEHGLTVLKDEQWKNARSIVSPTFSTAKLKAMYSLMNEVSDIYNKRLLEYADKQEIFNINILNGQYTLDNIASCLFGIDTNSLQNENVTLIKHLRKFFEIDLTNIYIYITIILPPLASYLGKKGYSLLPRDAMNYISNLVNQIVNRRRQHLERRNDFIQIMVDHEQEVTADQKLMEAKENADETESQQQQWETLKKTLTDKEIIGQALIFMIAGYETTSVLMSFFFYIMATEPTIQEKVYEEIRQELGDDEITYEKVSQLRYLDMVINETLRMYPPFIRFERVASNDYELGNYHIPKGSIISVPVYPIHHNPDFWTDPEKFIPERFLPAEKAKRHPMSFLPFGDGPRNCIGMRFALLEAKLAIVKALRIVEFQKCEKTEAPLQLGKLAILNTKNGIWLNVIRRSE